MNAFAGLKKIDCKYSKCTVTWYTKEETKELYCCDNCEIQDKNLKGLEKSKIILGHRLKKPKKGMTNFEQRK